MSAVMDEEMMEQPGDDEPVTRGEHRRLTILLARRLLRLEGLCFDDVTDDNGKVTRPSLEHFIEKADQHISVMCDWARIAKTTVAAVVAIGGGLIAIVQVVEFLRVL